MDQAPRSREAETLMTKDEAFAVEPCMMSRCGLHRLGCVLMRDRDVEGIRRHLVNFERAARKLWAADCRCQLWERMQIVIQ